MSELKKKGSGVRHRASGKTHQPIPKAVRRAAGATNCAGATTDASMEEQIASLETQIAALAQASGFRHQASGTGHQASGAGHQASGIRHQASGIRHQAPDSRLRTPDAIGALADASCSDSGIRHQASGIRYQASGGRLQGEASNTNPEAWSLEPDASPRIQFPAPVLGGVFATGPNAVSVSWNAVPGVSGYTLKIADTQDLSTYSHSIAIPADMIGTVIGGLEPGTTYWIGLRANAPVGDTHLNYVVAKVVTPDASTPGTVSDLQNWLSEMQTVTRNFATLLPQLETTVLTTADRRRLMGSGVRRYGYADKVSDVAAQYPRFWPASADLQDALKGRLREIETLRNLLVWLRHVSRVTGDLLLIAGDDAFRMANTYYSTVRAAAQSRLPEAEHVFRMLQLFWQRPRNTSAEPTIPEVERDVRALLRGTKDGEIVVRNESDRVMKGEKTVLDETRKKPRGGTKIIETEEAE